MAVRPPRAFVAPFVALFFALFATVALPWGADGHHTVGALADRLIGAHAKTRVQALLGGLTLEQAAVWADCAKGVDPTKDFAYTAAGRYPECAVFETPDGEAEMIDFVRRNDTNCPRVAGDESCHKQYHYSDEAIQRSRYRLGDVGTRAFDVVGAIAAVTHVLKGEPAPAPFDIKNQREALLLLVHYVGDVEQPLHVGAVYLDASGRVVDPAAGAFDPATGTQGGNVVTTIRVAINRKAENLHATWDDIPASLQARHVGKAWLALARAVSRVRSAAESLWTCSASDGPSGKYISTQAISTGAFKGTMTIWRGSPPTMTMPPEAPARKAALARRARSGPVSIDTAGVPSASASTFRSTDTNATSLAPMRAPWLESTEAMVSLSLDATAARKP